MDSSSSQAEDSSCSEGVAGGGCPARLGRGEEVVTSSQGEPEVKGATRNVELSFVPRDCDDTGSGSDADQFVPLRKSFLFDIDSPVGREASLFYERRPRVGKLRRRKSSAVSGFVEEADVGEEQQNIVDKYLTRTRTESRIRRSLGVVVNGRSSEEDVSGSSLLGFGDSGPPRSHSNAKRRTARFSRGRFRRSRSECFDDVKEAMSPGMNREDLRRIQSLRLGERVEGERFPSLLAGRLESQTLAPPVNDDVIVAPPSSHASPVSPLDNTEELCPPQKSESPVMTRSSTTGGTPDDMKLKLLQWAKAVASSVRQSY